MAQYIAKEIKCVTAATINDSSVIGLAETNQYCLIGTTGYYNRYASFYQYDLGTLKDEKVESAYLYLFVCGGGYIDYDTYSIGKIVGSWEEDTTNGTNQPDEASEKITFKFEKANAWKKIDITSIVQDWLLYGDNKGISVRNTNDSGGGGSTQCRNRYYTEDPSLASYIEINYHGQQMYKIAEPRLREIADEVRRITGTTESLTVDEMVTKLAEHEDVPSENLDEEIVTQDGLIEAIQAALTGKGTSGSGEYPIAEDNRF